MKAILLISTKLTKFELILFFSVIFSTAHGHVGISADEYYQQNISTSLPSEGYYSANLRSGWDEDDGPGGSGEGENNGVGVPIGDGFIAISFAIIIYSSFLLFKRQKVKQRVKH